MKDRNTTIQVDGYKYTVTKTFKIGIMQSLKTYEDTKKLVHKPAPANLTVEKVEEDGGLLYAVDDLAAKVKVTVVVPTKGKPKLTVAKGE